jgi:hypothetical protein
MSYARSKKAGYALGVAGLLVIGFLATSGQYVANPVISWPVASNTSLGNPSGAWSSGRYYYAPPAAITTVAPANQQMRMAPFYVPNRVTISSIAVDVTSAGEAGSLIRLGIFGDDGTGRPSSLVVDAGTVAGDGATGVKEITGLSASIGPGYYYATTCVQNAPTTQPTVRTVGSLTNGGGSVDAWTTLPAAGQTAVGFYQNSVSGAFPSTTTVGGQLSGNTPPRLIVKVL